ncbi:alcohol dehydrogenase [Moniliophthora roreri]|nr:alcohol dehydrogenase [Moniliophthora roreri]
MSGSPPYTLLQTSCWRTTAYYGWKEFSEAKKGEVAFVTTGAGPAGSLVIQLAKRDGLKVIAYAGSDEKVQLIMDTGADVAFDYKTTKISDVLAKEGQIDIYWDHVGGEMLDDASIAPGATLESSSVARFQATIRNLYQIVYKAVSLGGFYVFKFD